MRSRILIIILYIILYKALVTMSSLINQLIKSLQCFIQNPTPKFDPNAEESGKIWDFRSFDCNMYWLLVNRCIQKNLNLGLEVGNEAIKYYADQASNRSKCLSGLHGGRL